MTTPAPGFVAPNPRTWAAGDFLTTPRLRGDMTNLGLLFAGHGRPILVSTTGFVQQLPANFALYIFLGGTTSFGDNNAVALNTWNVPVVTATGQPYYEIPLVGWYLVQADVTIGAAGTPGQNKYVAGTFAVQNGVSGLNTDGGAVPGSTSTNNGFGTDACELYQCNTFAATGDKIAVYAATSNPSTSPAQIVASCGIMIEWVGLPSQGATLTGYTGPYGTVVSAPVPASPWPSGQGTTQVAGTAPGATFVSVADSTGIVVGGTIGLGYINGTPLPPGSTGAGVAPETVTVTSVAGPTIGISAASYGHAAGDPVAVPISAAFMNQQSRDLIRFLAYPPMLRAFAGSTQSFGAQTLPAGTQVTFSGTTIDNFSGFASSTYTVPVSGCYLVYGQVYFNGSTAGYAAACGFQIGSGTIQWGVRYSSATSSGAQPCCPTVRRVVRVTAGQTIKLYGTTGTAMGTQTGALQSKFIIVWRSF